MWHFKQVKSDHIKKAVNIFDLVSALNCLDANDQVSIFNSTIMNIVTDFIPNEAITCDDRDPLWMNSFIKNLSTRRLFVQSNLSIADMLYNGHLVIADTVLRNRPNRCQTLIEKPLYSGHFYSGHLL